MKKPLVILTGPTAVGKTKASISLAKAINGEIISADSMQVYKYMDIGSAKIRTEEMQGVKHYLVDVLEPDEEFHVVRFQQMAKEAMEEIYAKGKVPIIVGGTGFYIQAILNDIDFTENEEDSPYREELEIIAREQGNEVLHEGIKKFMEHLKTNAYFSVIASSLGRSVVPNIPEVVWKKKGYRLAGTACPQLNKIEMNTNYLHSPDAMEFIRSTMLHELAHILNAYYGGRNHDKQWKNICYIIGDDGGRCHNYRKPENAPEKKQNILKCIHCGHEYSVSTYKYNRHLRYRCKCGNKLFQV